MRLFRQQSVYEGVFPDIKGRSRWLTRLLWNRGCRSAEEAERFLSPLSGPFYDPFLFEDMHKAVDRLSDAVRNGERVCIFGDYDVDGICATSILMLYLGDIGVDAFAYIPSRHDEGYGMSIPAVEEVKRRGAQLIITVDNGVKAINELKLCAKLGMDVIVTDHHRPGDTLPECTALLCHTVTGCGYPNKSICGAGVAYKLVEAHGGSEKVRQYMHLAGIATIADVVEIRDENRAFAATALHDMSDGKCRMGIKALMALCMKENDRIDSAAVGFRIAPRLNAASRMDSAMVGVELLTTDEPREAERLAETLHQLNSQRQAQENTVVTQAAAAVESMDISDKRIIVLASPEWNVGVVGIAAARIAERYYRPTILLTSSDGILTGSCRSIAGVDIHDALASAGELMLRFGGHAYAAGLTIEEAKLGQLTSRLDAYLHENTPAGSYVPVYTYEIDAELSDMTLELADDIALLEPFGEGNNAPVFRTNGATLRRLRKIGERANHLSFDAVKGGSSCQCIFFNGADRFNELNQADRVELLYTISRNDYAGMSSAKAYIKAISPQMGDDAEAYVERFKDKFYSAFSHDLVYNEMYAEILPKTVDTQSCAETELNESFFGTMVLCFTPDGAVSALNALKGLPVDICVGENPKTPSAHNCIVCAPIIDRLDMSRFTSVIIYDTPVVPGIAAAVVDRAKGARVVMGKPMSPDGILEAMAFDRAFLGRCFKTLSTARFAFYSLDIMRDYLKKNAPCSLYKAELAVKVLGELSLIKGEQDGDGLISVVNDGEKRELLSSPTYKKLSELPKAALR